MNKTLIILAAVCLMLGALMGYSLGFSAGLSWAFDKAMVLMERQGLKFEFNENMVKTALYQYKNNIGGCLFTESIKNGS